MLEETEEVSNNSGAFERAKDEWNCALLHLTGDLGRGGLNVVRVGNMFLMNSNRREFYEHHQLVAFPSLDRLAFMLRLNEKTVRRARNKLVELGLITVAHRYNNSNYYCLKIPAAARDHSEVCIDLLTSPRHRATKTVSPDHDTQMSDLATGAGVQVSEGCTQMSGGVDNYAPNHDVNVQLPTEDSLTYPPSLREDAWAGCEEKKEENKESAEEAREVKEDPEPIAQPLSFDTDSPPTPSRPKPTLEELRIKLNMPELGKSIRRMHSSYIAGDVAPIVPKRRTDDE
jgi:hypothetical protein